MSRHIIGRYAAWLLGHGVEVKPAEAGESPWFERMPSLAFERTAQQSAIWGSAELHQDGTVIAPAR